MSRAERRRLARERAKKFLQEKVHLRPGKQPGASGATLAKAPEPERTVVHFPQTCCSCGGSLEGAEVTAAEVRQVFDSPEQRLAVTEHQAEARRCRCGAITKARFPREAKATTCYEPVVSGRRGFDGGPARAGRQGG